MAVLLLPERSEAELIGCLIFGIWLFELLEVNAGMNKKEAVG